MTKVVHDDNYYFDVIRRNIKKYRKEKKLTQQQLADRSNVTMNYIAKLESQKMNRGVTIPVLGRIADSLDINIRDLLNEKEETKQK